jgi:hypothetical protein
MSAAGPVAAPLPPPFASNLLSDAGRDVLLAVHEESITPGREQALRDAVVQLLAALSARDRVGLVTVPGGGANVGLTRRHDNVRLALAEIVARAPRGETASDAACRTRLTLESLKALVGSVSAESPTTVVFFSNGLTPASSSAFARAGTPSELCEIRSEDFQAVATAVLDSPVSFYVVQVLDNTGSASAGSSSTTAGLESAMTRVARETSAYYFAAFEPEASEQDGSSHRIDLRVGREGIKVRTRPRLTIPKTGGQAAGPTARDMLRATKVIRDLPLAAAGYASRNSGDDQVKVVTLLAPLGRSVTLTSAVVGLFDDKGRLRAQWTARAADLARAPLIAAVAAPAGTYRLRVAATDASGRGGTVDEEMRVELIQAGPMKVSALALGASENGTFVPKLQFTTEPAVIVYLEIYGTAKNGSVSASIELAASNDGPALVSVPATIRPTTAEDVRIVLGGFMIGTLLPGDFIVRVIISLDGQPVGRVFRTLRKAER